MEPKRLEWRELEAIRVRAVKSERYITAKGRKPDARQRERAALLCHIEALEHELLEHRQTIGRLRVWPDYAVVQRRTNALMRAPISQVHGTDRAELIAEIVTHLEVRAPVGQGQDGLQLMRRAVQRANDAILGRAV